MVNISSKSEALKRVREAQTKANEARVERVHQNVDDAASFLVELGRLAAVDEWEENRILEIRAEGERRRHQHRQAGAAAVARIQGRGETLEAIGELEGVKVGEVCAVLKAAIAQAVVRSDAQVRPTARSRRRCVATRCGCVASRWCTSKSLGVVAYVERRRYRTTVLR
jgi:hypothetical protein